MAPSMSPDPLERYLNIAPLFCRWFFNGAIVGLYRIGSRIGVKVTNFMV